jgi:hypothetical protein
LIARWILLKFEIADDENLLKWVTAVGNRNLISMNGIILPAQRGNMHRVLRTAH